MKILVVDDERNILEIVEAYLAVNGYLVYTSRDGSDALEKVKKIQPDLVVLDLMLPDIDGLTVCKKIRSSSNLPIIMLTAKSSEKDILTGLKLGADDYVVKPFSPKELVARIESVLRRTHTSSAVNKMIFNNEKMKILLDSKQVFVDQVEKDLTKSEFNILVTLAKTPNKVFSRAELIDRIKEMEFEGLERSIDSHIKNLRLKIEEEPKKPTYIITVHGSGYKFGWSS